MLIILSVFLVLIICSGAASASSETNQTLTTEYNDEIVNVDDTDEKLTVEVSSAGSDDDSGLKELESEIREKELNKTNFIKKENNLLKASNDNQLLGNTIYVEGSTFADIQNAINRASAGDTIYLNSPKYVGSGTEISINKELTIIGCEGCQLDAQGQSRIFNITGNNVIVKNMTLINAKCTKEAGITYGGAIHWSGSKGHIINCTFINNTAGSGNGIYWSASGTVSNCTFINNMGNYCGSVHFESDNSIINNSTFINNHAGDCGGAIHINGRNCNITNCNFINNTATNNGGAIGDEFFTNIINCTFTNNRASGKSGRGGAISTGSSSVINCNFTNNSAYRGGAVYDKSSVGSLNVINSNFTKNTASYQGSAIFSNSGVSSTNSTFISNKASCSLSKSIYGSKLSLTFYGNDNWINAIYTNRATSFNNVTYWNGTSVVNSDIVTSTHFYYGNITLEIYDSNYNLVDNISGINTIKYDFSNQNEEYIYIAYHKNDDYYSYSEIKDTIGPKHYYITVLNNQTSYYAINDPARLEFTIKDLLNNTLSLNYNYIDFYIGDGIMSAGPQEVVGTSDTITISINYEWEWENYWEHEDEYENANLHIEINRFDDDLMNSYWYSEDIDASSSMSNTYVDIPSIPGNYEISLSLDQNGGEYLSYYYSDTLTVSKVNFIHSNSSEIDVTSYDGLKFFADYKFNQIGNYTVSAKLEPEQLTYNGYTYALGNVFTGDIIVKNNTYDISVDVDSGENTVINVTVPIDVTGNVTVNINNTVYPTILVEPGIYQVVVALPGGKYTVNATVSNDPKYADKTSSNVNVILGDFDILQKIVNNAHENSVITLTRNYTYTIGLDTITEGVVINKKNLTINGNGYTINALGKSRIFNVIADEMTLNDVTLVNGNYSSDLGGGSIYWSGDNGNVSDCNFINNNASFRGGAIYWKGVNGTVFNSNFTENTAIEVAGAIYWDGAEGFVSNCNFKDNTADFAGAIGINADNSTISDCNFNNNNASIYDEGGAILINKGTNNSCIYNCNFVNNSAFIGAAIGLQGNNINVSNCNFTNNNASRGAVCFSGINETISNCNFINNTATYGGAIFIPNMVIVNSTISNCNFINNSAIEAGAIYWYGKNITLLNSNFTGNNATYGGAIVIVNNYAVSSCNFMNNSANIWGGAFYTQNCKGTLSNCNFTNNTAYMGGAFYDYEGNMKLYNSSFLINKVNSTIIYNEESQSWIFRGHNTHFNAFYINNGVITSENITYYWDDEIVNTTYIPNSYKGFNITLEIYNSTGDLVDNITSKTNADSKITYDYSTLDDGNYTYKAYHLEDNYYRYSQLKGSFNIISYDIIVLDNKTVYVNQKSTIKFNATIHDVNNQTINPRDTKLIFIHLKS